MIYDCLVTVGFFGASGMFPSNAIKPFVLCVLSPFGELLSLGGIPQNFPLRKQGLGQGHTGISC